MFKIGNRNYYCNRKKFQVYLKVSDILIIISGMTETFKKLEKYNFWHTEKIPTGFLRNTYLQKIKKYMGNNLIKVLMGQRRVGKSYILRQIIQMLINEKINPKNIFYLNKELIEFDEIKNYTDLAGLIEEYRKRLKPKGKIYVMLDEIQEISEWEKIVNSLAQNYKRPHEIFITGSNSHLLSGELATYLSGRSIAFEILPFLFGEFCEYFSLKKNKENYLNYMRTGGLPELYNLQDREAKINYIASLKNTILLKDIVARFNIKDVNLLEDLFIFLAGNIGNLFSINKIVQYLKSHKRNTNHETIANYIDYLKQSFIIHEVDKYDIRGKAVLAGNKKYYLNDLAFRTYPSSGFDEGIGKNLENMLYMDYRAQGYQIYVGSMEQEEVDFILEKGNERKYIQIAYLLSTEKVIKRELRSLQKIRDAHEKIIISLDEISFGNKDGIKHLTPWEEH